MRTINFGFLRVKLLAFFWKTALELSMVLPTSLSRKIGLVMKPQAHLSKLSKARYLLRGFLMYLRSNINTRRLNLHAPKSMFLLLRQTLRRHLQYCHLPYHRGSGTLTATVKQEAASAIQQGRAPEHPAVLRITLPLPHYQSSLDGTKVVDD